MVPTSEFIYTVSATAEPYSPAVPSAFFTVAGEQPITRAMWRNPVPVPAILRHCSACQRLSTRGRPTRFPLARTRASPSRIRSLVESTW